MCRVWCCGIGVVSVREKMMGDGREWKRGAADGETSRDERLGRGWGLLEIWPGCLGRRLREFCARSPPQFGRVRSVRPRVRPPSRKRAASCVPLLSRAAPVPGMFCIWVHFALARRISINNRQRVAACPSGLHLPRQQIIGDRYK